MAHVLVVEDEPAVREVVVKMLDHHGHDVVSAFGGLDAIRKIKTNSPFDLLVTDIMMPDMTGIKLIDNVRKLLPEIKIIAISGGGPRHYSPDVCLQLARERGADRMIMKPIIMKKFLETTTELLNAI